MGIAAVRSGIRERFKTAVDAKKHAGHNVDAGRKWVHAYATFLHYADGIHRAAMARHAAGEEHAPKHEPAAPKHEH